MSCSHARVQIKSSGCLVGGGTHRVRAEELSQNSVAAFRNQEKQFRSCSLFFLAEHKRLDFTRKDTTGGYLKKEKKKNLIEHKKDFYFCLRTFQGAAQSRIF